MRAWASPQDAAQNALKNAVIDPLTSDPVSPVTGQLWYRSDLGQWRTYNGSAVEIIDSRVQVNNQIATSYTITLLDELVTSSASSGPATFTLPQASTCIGKRVTTYNLSPTQSLSTARTGTDKIYSLANGTGQTIWFVDAGIGAGTTFVAIAANVWVVVTGYGLDVFWGWVNRGVDFVADADHSAVNGQFATSYTSLSADRTVTMPLCSSADNHPFMLLLDTGQQATGTKRILVAPSGSDTINGLTGSQVAVNTAGGWAMLLSDSTSNYTLVQLGTLSLAGLGVHTVADTNVTVGASDDLVIFTSLTGARVATMPAATRTRPVAFFDQSGNASATNTISLARAGSDTINKSASNLVIINTPRTSAVAEPDQVSDWMVDPIEVDTVNAQTIGGAKTFSSDVTAPNLLLTGQATEYLGVTLTRAGVGSQVATLSLATQAAAITATTLYAVPAGKAGLYRFSYSMKVTRAATTSCALGGSTGVQLKYTDNIDSTNPTTPVGPFSATNTTVNQLTGHITVYAKASTNIQYLIGYTSSGATTMQYMIQGTLEYLG